MAGASSSSTKTQRILKRASPSSIQDKFLVGYQGWFTCAGDGEPIGPGHHGWLHWFNYPIPDGGRPNIDVWPDVSSYDPSELFPAPGLKFRSGEQAFLFSSRNPQTVQKHFHWMAEYGVDGAFLQRFAGQCDLDSGNEGIRKIRDEVGQRVREAAEKENRVFAIMYDVSGVPADKIQRILERDWVHLIRNQGILDSPRYLREKGKAVVALWGFGFHNAGHTPSLVRSIIKFFRDTTPGGVYIFGGAPSCWRLSEGDADRQTEFVDVWLNEFDAISPWTIGRYKTEIEADNFAETKMKGDMELIKRRSKETGRKVDYIPVVYPGGSGYNLSEGKWGFNDIKRQGGRFLWQQVVNVKRLGVRTVYGAMWDEYDEGTAFMPIVQHKHNLPQCDKFQFMALDQDGHDVPSDWYMRICGMAAEGLRSERGLSETFPLKELTDYWSTRPKYEEIEEPVVSASGSGNKTTDTEGGQSFQDWLATQNEDKDEPPPPPYTLTAGEEGPAVAPTSSNAQRPVQPSTSASSVAPSPAQPSPTPISTAPSSPNPSTIQGQQRPPQTVEPVAALANNFAQASISGPSSPQQWPGQNTAIAVPLATGASVSPPPLHPNRPAVNNPATYGRPTTAPRPQQGYPPGTDSISPPSQTPGPWSTTHWPPKEWGVNDTGSTSGVVGGGANLARPQTFSASSSHPSGPGANLRPSATISGAPANPVHRPPLRPNTAAGGSDAATSGGLPAPMAQTQSEGYRPPQQPPQMAMPEHPPAGFPDVSPTSPGGFAPYSPRPSGPSSSYSPGRPNFPEAPFVPQSTYPGGPSSYGWSGPSGGSPHVPSPPGGPPMFHNQAPYPYNNPQHQYHGGPPSQPLGFPNPPHGHIPVGPNMNAPAQYPPPPGPGYHGPFVPPGGPGYHPHPGGPAYPPPMIIPVGPMTFAPPPQHPYGPPSGYTGRGASNSLFDDALSAVDMVAGRKTRNQLENLANKFLK